MVSFREERMALRMQKLEEKHIHGIEAREKAAAELKDKRAQRVTEMMVCN